MLNVDGLVSGLDTSSIIEQILQLERRPIGLVARQVETARQRQTAFLDLSARFLNVQLSARRLSDPLSFQTVQANSSDEGSLMASASPGVPPGTYSFRVGQLSSSSQYISGGFASADSNPVGAGTLSLELGGGFVSVRTELDELNGGRGVTRGSIRITDSTGANAVVDFSDAITVSDVIQRINETSGIQVSAAVSSDGRGLSLTDDAGGTITVEEVAGLDTAADLGIVGSATGTLAGSVVRRITDETLLATLSDGLGVRTQSGDDLVITAKDGASYALDLSDVSTVNDLIQAFETTTGGAVTLAVDPAGDSFVVTDTTGGGGNLVIANGMQSGASAATDLGLEEAGTAATSVQGDRVLAGIDDLLLGTLNGGTAFAGGAIDIQDRNGAVTNVDLSASLTLQDVLTAINTSGAAVTATVNPEGNGLLLRDTSGGVGTFSVSESGGGSAAAQLGILASVDDEEINGSDLDPRYIHANTRLDTLNGGRGIGEGKIRITDTNGVNFVVDLGQEETMGDVLRDIQGAAAQAGSTVDVAFNDAGNGLVLTDTSGGTTALQVEEVSGGTTARDLHLLGTADSGSPGVLDGAFQETITISDTDTLEDVRQALEALNIDVTATIVNDGSSLAPFRLNIVSGVSGQRARLLVDTEGATNLQFARTGVARDGVLFYGETGSSSESILIRSGDNTYRDIVEGLTVTALSVSEAPVQISVQSDTTRITETMAEFVEGVNSLLEQIKSATSFNLETEQRGVLLGDGTIRTAKRSLLRSISNPLSGLSNEFSLLSQVGVRVVRDRLTFDASDLESALAQNPDAVKDLFSAKRRLDETVRLEDFDDGNGVDIVPSGPELRIQLRDGTDVDVDLDGAVTTRDVVDAINLAGAAAGLTAELSSSQNSFVLTDATSGTETLRVTALNSSAAANNLGLNKTADVSGGAVLTGFEIDLSGDVGIMARVDDAIERLVSTEGSLQRRADGFDVRIEDLEDRMEQMEERVLRREDLLRRQFAQLEQIISSSQSTQARLAATLGGLGGA